MGKFCAESSFEIVIISHNLTNKFQSLDISANKAAKSFISDKYNAWLANEVSKQLRAEKAAVDVKVSLNSLLSSHYIGSGFLNSLLSSHYIGSGLLTCTTLLKMTRKWQ